MDELEAFKTVINLTEYAAAEGYELDRKESSKTSIIMHHPNGDKLVIARDTDNHWIYFSVRNEADNGSIIDFVQKRGGGSLGAVRQKLRPWIGESYPVTDRNQRVKPPAQSYVQNVEKSGKDIARVVLNYSGMEPITGREHYLVTIRGIPPNVLLNPRFAGKIRTLPGNEQGNVVFPHYNAAGLCGYEIKNSGFTGFAKGGEKGLWASAANSQDTTLIITESAIDALSYHALHHPTQARYVSTGGAMNPAQPTLLQRAISRIPEGGEIVIATDNDEGGDKLTAEITALILDTSRRYREHRPATRGHDWNDTLRTSSPLKSQTSVKPNQEPR